ncbi:MAG TPA: hypothetical protein VNX01_13200, partial [Bacteroidia bacterium]|nr:hypothetical protein [Bacteroidia bacterium]
MKTPIQNLALVIIVCYTLFTGKAKGQIGALDTSFHTGMGAQKINHIAAPIYASTIQSDGKIVFGGIVQLYNGDSLPSSTFRLNTNGSLDTSYHSISTEVGVNGEAINALVQQSDGKIIAAGAILFSDSNMYYNRVSRFNSNGNWDTTFNANVNPYYPFSTNYMAVAVQADGKLIVGGGSVNFNQALNILRLNTNGAMDTSFHVGTGAKPYSANTVRAIAIQTDGRVIIGGAFTTYNGVSVKRIARLNTDGSLDNTFDMSLGANGTVETISIQNDGKIIIGGSFTAYNGTAIKGLARLNTDGTLDNAFNTGVGINTAGIIYTTIIQADGRIIIGGYFTSYNGISSKGLARLNTNGSFDGSFNVGTGLPSSSAIYATSIQADGKIIIAGNFATYNGTTVNSLARLLVTPVVGLNDTIKGTVYNDINNNCARDFGEVGLPNTWVMANPGAHAALTDSLGNYAITVDTGTYIVTQILNTQYANHCVTSQTVTLSVQNPNAVNINWADGLNPSISGTVYD